MACFPLKLNKIGVIALFHHHGIFKIHIHDYENCFYLFLRETQIHRDTKGKFFRQPEMLFDFSSGQWDYWDPISDKNFTGVSLSFIFQSLHEWEKWRKENQKNENPDP